MSILLTGASRGIGRAIALALGRAGAQVGLVARDAQALEALAGQIRTDGGDAAAIPADVADEQALLRVVRTINDQWGQLDVLINNAGVAEAGPFEKTSTASWDHQLAVNARAAFILCRECLPLLRKTGGAKIINVSSSVGVKGYARQVAYTASKHALRGMSIALANELRDEGILVHVISPGGVATDLVRDVRPDIDESELMQPEEIADAVVYLLTRRGNAVIDELRFRRRSAEPWF